MANDRDGGWALNVGDVRSAAAPALVREGGFDRPPGKPPALDYRSDRMSGDGLSIRSGWAPLVNSIPAPGAVLQVCVQLGSPMNRGVLR